ncbi:MAG: M28 family peptidase [Elusimicrobiota bacterium]|jgi:hypothetical protein
MRTTPLFARTLILLLAGLLPVSASGQTLSATVGRHAEPSAAVGSVGAIPASFLGSLSVHLEQAGLRLGAGLPGTAVPSLEAQSAGQESLPGASLPDLGPSAAEYLARAALSGPMGAPATPEAQAAAVLAKALADPAAAQAVADALRRQGGDLGARLASKLENVAQAADANPYLKQLGSDLSIPDDSGLSALFDGAAPAAPSLTTPEEFASYAARRFMGGSLLPGGKAAVLYSRREQSSVQAVPDDKEMYDEMDLSPWTNEEREKIVGDLFRQAGAKPEEVILQDTGYGTHNVYVVKKGRTDRVVVIGAHHDKADVGRGTIDNWTGATMVPNLYQALRDVETEATMIFAVFAREEEGLIGSTKFVRSLTSQQRAKVDAMVNMDTLAVDGTFLWKNNSDKSLLKRMVEVAKRAALAVAEVVFWGGDADSTSFRQAGIPGITVFGASPEVVFDIIHSENDTMKAFSLPHYKNAYHLVLETLKDLDTTPIGRINKIVVELARKAAAFLSGS